MAEIAGKTAVIYVLGGTSAMTGSTGTVLGSMDSAGLSQIADMLDITAFGASSKVRIPGIKDTNIEASGNYDPSDAGQTAIQTAYDNGTTIFVGIYPQGTSIAGKQVQCYVESIESKATPTGKQTFAPKFSAIALPVALPARS